MVSSITTTLLTSLMLTCAVHPGRTQPVHLAQSDVVVCSPAATCVPHWTTTVLVYVRDSSGAAVGGARVMVAPRAVPDTSALTAVADDHGVAHFSLPGGAGLTVTVSMTGFITVSSDVLQPPAGTLVATSVTLVVDSAAVSGVLPIR